MAVSYKIQDDGKIVLARYIGTVTGAEISKMFADYLADPDFALDRPHLVDTSALAETDAGFSEIFSIFSQISRSYETTNLVLRVAIYAPADLTFGLSRIFQNLAESSRHIETEVFTDFDSAHAWALAAQCSDAQTLCDPG